MKFSLTMEMVAYLMAIVLEPNIGVVEVLSLVAMVDTRQLVIVAFTTTFGPAVNIAYPAKHPFTSDLEQQRHK